jgi:hypothetical protein
MQYYISTTKMPPAAAMISIHGLLSSAQQWVPRDLTWCLAPTCLPHAAGDYPRKTWLESVEYLLANELEVSVVHGNFDSTSR